MPLKNSDEKEMKLDLPSTSGRKSRGGVTSNVSNTISEKSNFDDSEYSAEQRPRKNQRKRSIKAKAKKIEEEKDMERKQRIDKIVNNYKDQNIRDITIEEYKVLMTKPTETVSKKQATSKEKKKNKIDENELNLMIIKWLEELDQAIDDWKIKRTDQNFAIVKRRLLNITIICRDKVMSKYYYNHNYLFIYCSFKPI